MKLNTLRIALNIICCILPVCAMSCTKEVGMERYGDAMTVRIAVILPLSDGQKKYYESSLEWAAENIERATEGLFREIKVEYEWYDEETEDMGNLAIKLKERQDIHAVIGPYASVHTREFASEIRNWLLPVFTLCSSEAVIRENIPSMKEGEFLWALQEADISQCELLLTLAQRNGADTVSLLVKGNDPYGQTFLDWFGFQSSELGLANDKIIEYTPESLAEDMKKALLSNDTKALIAVPSNTEEAKMMVRTETLLKEQGMDGVQVYYSDIAMNHSVFAFQGSGRSGTQGVSVIASPESGFEVAFKVRTGMDMLNIESQIYDAAMLASMAVFDTEARLHDKTESYDQNNIITRNRAFNRALARIVDGRENTTGAMTWQPDDMRNAFCAMERGRYVDISGASGELDFDSQVYTNVLHSTYCHWQYFDGNFLRINYMTSDGSRRTESTLGCWNWSTSGGQSFESGQEIRYPELEGNKAVLVSASYLWNDYRHQADVMAMYRLLRENGYSDDDIILVMENNLAYNENNLYPGVVRTSTDGTNLYDGDMEVDYTLTGLGPDELHRVLCHDMDTDTADNVLMYWCGHGNTDYLAYGDHLLDKTWLGDVIGEMYGNGKYRKLFCLIEACFSGGFAEECTGIPGVVLYTATNPNETSKAENFDPEMDIYLTDRFSSAFRQAISDGNSHTMAELYYYLYSHTPGSHVTVYNSENFGNLYTTRLEEFL